MDRRSLAVLVLVISCFMAPSIAFNATTIKFEDGYSPLFGGDNVVRSIDGRRVSLLLDRYTGSGFISLDYYNYGLFSASIKLPSDYTAGVVVAFYTTNGDVFEKTHDELDFEFLGNIRGLNWRVQTNVYGNGSTNRGREERYVLPFDPTREAHRYSILWTPDTIIFYIDETPIREVIHSNAMGGDYPSKPMALYATIWDGSTWATAGGKYKANYKYAPFVSDFSDLVLNGCRTSPIQQLPSAVAANDDQCANPDAELATMTAQKRAAMLRFRERYMTYSFCYDTIRYPVSFSDCHIIESERRRFEDDGHTRSWAHRGARRTKRRSKLPVDRSDRFEV